MADTTGIWDPDERVRRIQTVVEGVAQRRATGESLPDEQLIAQHPDLTPQSLGLYGLRLLKNTLRIIGNVHAQVTDDDLACSNCQSYLGIITNASFSAQLGDMGDRESYIQ